MNKQLLTVLAERISAAYASDKVKPAWTPFELADEMLNQIGLHGSILVISDLGFIPALKRRGADLSAVTFVAHTAEQADLADQMGVGRVIQTGYNDPIKELEAQLVGLKFDIVVGNPPYQPAQEPGKTFSGAKLWPQFIDLADRVTKEGGVFSLITPQGWLRPSRVNRSYKTVFNQEVLFVSCGIDGKVFGSGVGTIVGYFVTRKAARAETYRLRISDGTEITAQNDGVTLYPNTSFKGVDLGILQKTINSGAAPLQLEHVFYPAKLGFSDSPSSDFKYPAFLEANRVVYLKDQHVSARKKLVVFRILRRSKGLLVLQTRIDSEHAVMSDHGIHPYILESDTVNVEHVEAYLQSKLVRFLISLFSATAHMPLEVLRLIPQIDFSRRFTDEELFAHFDLGDAEIERITSTVK